MTGWQTDGYSCCYCCCCWRLIGRATSAPNAAKHRSWTNEWTPTNAHIDRPVLSGRSLLARLPFTGHNARTFSALNWNHWNLSSAEERSAPSGLSGWQCGSVHMVDRHKHGRTARSLPLSVCMSASEVRRILSKKDPQCPGLGVRMSRLGSCLQNQGPHLLGRP